MPYTADFETTTAAADCRVWLWGLMEIGNYSNFKHGTTIESFMEELRALAKKRETVYFHNLKFDGEFLIWYLFHQGFRHVKRREGGENTFTSLISDKGMFYSLEITFKQFSKTAHKVKLLDSLKILPMSIEDIAHAFALPVLKGSIDYRKKRPVGYEPTEEEIAYVRNDVEIAARALRIMFDQGLDKMTISGDAMLDYKNIIGRKAFERWFPTPEYDADVRQAYRGGFTYANPAFTGRELGPGIVLDINSLYPDVMYHRPLPYGEPKFFTGRYEPDNLYKLYVQMFVCQFSLKPGMLPTVQLKQNPMFIPTEYVTDSGGEDVALCMTNVDLELFLEHYDVYNVEWISGWKFKASNVLFTDFILKWYNVKQQATLDGNKALRTLAKLMLNSSYGRFSINPKVRSKIPVLDEETDTVRYPTGPEETRRPIYIPVGAFITAWARDKTIRAAQSVCDRFLYADTDSLHLLGTELPPELDIDPVKLGAWKHESTFTRAKYLRAKTYVEEIDGKLCVTCAGLPEKLHKQVTFDNFEKRSIYTGKLKPTHVRGGIILDETDFTIR